MSKSNSTINSKQDYSTLVRPMFSPGMLLQHEDLEQLNAYTRDLSRLLFKSLFGCGVICGLVVTVNAECGKVRIKVGAGVALACSGDPVAVPNEQTLVFDENCDLNIDGPLWVVLCGTTKYCAPRTSLCTSDDDEATSVCTRERDMFEIRVMSGSDSPKCACSCTRPDGSLNEDCYNGHYGGECGCSCGDGSDCDCKCILLARLDKPDKDWVADHGVRRFIRPKLAPNPVSKIVQQGEPEEKKLVAVKEQLLRLTQEKAQIEDQLFSAVEEKKQLALQLQELAEGQRQVEPQNAPVANNAEEISKKDKKNAEAKP